MRKLLLILASVVAMVSFIRADEAVAATAMEEINVRGRLARTVEAGGWLITTEKQKYLLLNAERFQNESWFREGAEVEASGETKPDTMTIYQEGVPFEARTLRQRGSSSSGGGSTVTAGSGGSKGLTRVMVSGDALVQAQPDTAIITIAVVTQNTSASEAQAENASKTEAVMRAVKAAAGANSEVKTSGYSLQPQYVYKQNETPTISGYLARNSIVVTMSELNRVGALIDAASRAGANNIDNLSFTLRRDQPARAQALTEATREAVTKAHTLAQTLGGRVARIIEVQESSFARPPIIYAREAETAMMARAPAADMATPVEVGSLEIRAQVQLVAEIEI